jgi:excisionase family DNA binding protein
MLEAALRDLIASAVSEATAPLVREVRELRAVVAAKSSKWVSRADAAEALGVSTDTISRRCADGSLRSRKLGRSVRVLLESPATEDQISVLAAEARG